MVPALAILSAAALTLHAQPPLQITGRVLAV